MRRYGSTRGRMYGGLMAYEDCRPKDCRGNRGRNRSSAFPYFGGRWARNKHFSSPIDTAIGRSLRKAARQQGQKEIAEELGLWQLERDFARYLARPHAWKESTSRLFDSVISEQEMERAQVDAMYEKQCYDDMMELIWDERDADDERNPPLGRAGYAGIGRDAYDWSDNGEEDWDIDWDMDTIDPMEPQWVPLWVDGQVHDPKGRDFDSYGFEQIRESYCGDCAEYWEHCDCDTLAVMFAPRLPMDSAIHSDDDRNNERLRAGERYFKQRGRTVHKAGVVYKTQRSV